MFRNNNSIRLLGGPGRWCGPPTHKLMIGLSVDNDHELGAYLTATIVGYPDVGIEEQVLEPSYLAEAASVSGEYPVFTCWCGSPGCDGFDSVMVEAGPDSVCWVWVRNGRMKVAVFDRYDLGCEIGEGVKRLAGAVRVLDKSFLDWLK